MKRIFFGITLFLLGQIHLQAQCEFPNESFEIWINDEMSSNENDPNSVHPFVRPEGHSSVIRTSILALGLAFGDSQTVDEIVNNTQSAFGIHQSTDAYQGEFAAKIQADSFIELSDLFTVFDCTEVPVSIDFSIKHVGTNTDTLIVLSVFDEGLNELPEDENELMDYPAFGYAEYAFDEDTEYTNLSIPVNTNFEAAIDTGYVIFILSSPLEQLEAGDSSYVLIDGVKLSNVIIDTDELHNLEFSLHPNPTDDFINIQMNHSSENHIVEITNLQGKILYNQYLKKNQINVSDLSSGIYMLKIINDKSGEYGTKRFIKK